MSAVLIILPLKSLQPFPNSNNNNNNKKRLSTLFYSIFHLDLYQISCSVIINYFLLNYSSQKKTVTQTQVTKKHPKLYWTSMEMWKSVQLGIIIFHNPVQIIMLPQRSSVVIILCINLVI